ncbi:hypothetical protein BS47DRAFT_1368245 [Hydnum rufescens UP504]|uniref:Uncharacterized protein n=1 Tax=Hydnum rufescens UP504 TaxID=1448309 RepID=A0A9P6DP13_9AGAM|nr:hypothetical protein BS47DRAFT_1368245 [Hydnum rufescens UP504]
MPKSNGERCSISTQAALGQQAVLHWLNNACVNALSAKNMKINVIPLNIKRETTKAPPQYLGIGWVAWRWLLRKRRSVRWIMNLLVGPRQESLLTQLAKLPAPPLRALSLSVMSGLLTFHRCDHTNKWFSSLHLDLETIPVYLHPFLILRILLVTPHLLLVLPLHFLVFLVLNHPVFLMLNCPIFLMLNRPVFLVLNRPSPAQSPTQAATWSPQPPSHTSSHTFGNSPFVGDFDHEVEPSGLYHQHENLVILDPPNPNDGNPDVEDDDSVAEEGDTAQIKSQGGPFTDKQVAEIRGIVESMNCELECKAKEWDRPLESVMWIRNLAISMREQRSAGNPWNAYQASYEKDPKPDHPHHEYVEKVIQPAYRELIAAHGGEDSDAWKKKSKELVDQHNASKAAQAFDIALSPATMGKVLWNCQQAFLMRWLRKQNALFTGSPVMKDWLNLSFPKDRELEETLAYFFQPSADSTKVRVTQLKHIAQENNGKLPSDTGSQKSPMQHCQWDSISRRCFWAQEVGLSRWSKFHVGGQSSGTTWGGAGSSINGVVNDQFSGNASSGVINGPMDWAGGYGQTSKNTTHMMIP